MIVPTFTSLFKRDLLRLKKEIELYKEESRLWYIEKGIANSAGNLCLHLIGNLNYFIGVQIGGTNYVRNRELEFSLKDIPRAELIAKIEETIIIVEASLANMSDDQLHLEYPVVVFTEPSTHAFLLFHLTTHLTYHLGQINYHRRLLDI